MAWRQKVHADAGIGTYNEGCHDDVNKHVWLSIFWGCDVSATGVSDGCSTKAQGEAAEGQKALLDSTLRDYARVHFGSLLADRVAAGIYELERNWVGAVHLNPVVPHTLAMFEDIVAAMTPRNRWSWRLQQLFYRAHYDAFVHTRVEIERAGEAVALLSRPVCLPDPADETVRLPFDRANAELDERGYPTGRSLGGAVPTEYPLRETTMEDLGRIGGVGLRMYFTVIRGLAYVFAFLALCSIPVLISNGTGSMFDVFDARMYGCAGEACTAAECCSGSTVSDTTAAAVPVPPDATSWTADCEIAARGTCGEWESAGGLCVQPSELVATLST